MFGYLEIVGASLYSFPFGIGFLFQSRSTVFITSTTWIWIWISYDKPTLSSYKRTYMASLCTWGKQHMHSPLEKNKPLVNLLLFSHVCSAVHGLKN